MTPTREKIAEIKQDAERAYKEVRDFYEQTEREAPEHLTKRCKKITLAQMRVYSGIHNRDYGEYKKGVDDYERHSRTAVREAETRPTVCAIWVADEKAAEYGVPAHGFTRASPDVQREVLERKLVKYKGLYNELPRGYFKSA